MATLTETAYYARNIIKFGAIGLVVFFVARGTMLWGIAYWKRLHPPPPPPPTVAFGQLPKLIFPDLVQPIVTYKLETVTGGLPNLGDRVGVYFMPVKTASLLALERMQDLANKLEFNQNPDELSPTRYRWAKTDPLPATLTADIISGSFNMELSWNSDPGLLAKKQLPNETQAIDEAQGALQNLGLLADDLKTGVAKVTYLKVDINDLVKALSLSEADFVRVDLFRSSVQEMPVYPANPDRGVVSIILSGDNVSGRRLLAINYNYFPITYDQVATYPIKTSDEAWLELQSSKGFIARLDASVKQVVVRRVSLGYYDSVVPQNYLQPVYVFEGDNNFVGYVPAIPDEWIGE